jgi:hypothetical protein
MTLRTNDTLLYAKPRLDVDALIARLDRPDSKDITFLRKLAVWAAIAGVDDAVLAAMWLVETANGTSVRWNNDLNPGGIGIPDDSTVQPFKIADADEAARIFVQCVFALTKRAAHPDVPIPAAAQQWFGLVWLPKVQSTRMPNVVTVSDLNLHYTDARGEWQAAWAWNPDHITVLIARAANYLPDVPDQEFSLPHEGGQPVIIDSEGFELNMTPGLIPEAEYADSLVLDRETDAYDFLGQRVIRGVTLHRMLGSLEGTNTYFHSNAPGLTDMGIDADGTKMYRWNDATGAAHKDVSANRAPWASGPYRAAGAYGDGLKFVNKYGINAVNRDRRSLEIDGFYGDPWVHDSMREYAQTTAHDAHNYGVTWEQFPYVVKDDCSFVCWHNEFCGTDYKECPGSVVMAQTDEFIGMVKGIMKAAQQITASKPTEPPKPIPVSPYPKGMTAALAKRLYGSVKVPWASKPFIFDLKRSECRAWLTFCTANLKPGDSYEKGNWGRLSDVIRRGNKGSDGRVYQWANGFVYAVEPDDKQTGKHAA